jgi:hypothetical protein
MYPYKTDCYRCFALVSVVITGVGPDFTKMESFGKVEEFADTLVLFLDHIQNCYLMVLCLSVSTNA